MTDSVTAGASAKPLTPEEIADRLVPSDPQISPDGRNVAFVVGAASKKGEHFERTVWLARDGKPAAPFTSGVANDSYPRWSPDGTKVAFTSDRKERGKSKLYVIDVNGGEAQPLGDAEGELSAPVWSPDGTRIGLLWTDPQTAEQKKRKEDRDDAYVYEGEPERQRLWVFDASTGSGRQLTFGTRQVWSFAWGLDGTNLAVVTTESHVLDATCGEGDVWTVPVTGGLMKHVARFPSLPGSPIFVEGGIVVSANWHWDDPVDSVWLIPTGGEPRNLLPDYHGNIEAINAIHGDAGRVIVKMVEGTHAIPYALDIATGSLTCLAPTAHQHDGSLTSPPSLSADGSTVAYIWADGDQPQEVFTGPAGGEVTAVTELGKPFAGRLSKVDVVTWESDGWEIQGLLTYPAGYEAGKRYPLIVEIHGGPSWQWEDYCFLDWHDWAQLMASHGFAVLAPNPRGSTARGKEFQRQLQNDVGGGEVRDLVNGALAMVERGIADGDRLGIGGWSWGGYLTATTITKSTIFKAAMMGAGLSNLISDHGTDDIPSANTLYFSQTPYQNFSPYWEGSALKNVTACTTPTLIIHGDEDARVQWSQGAEMYRALKTLGVPVEFVRYPREGHPFHERLHQIDMMKRLVAWYSKYLK